MDNTSKNVTALISFLLFSFSGIAQVKAKIGELHPSRTVKIQIINEAKALHHCFKAQNQYDNENYKSVIRQCQKALDISPSCSPAFRLRGYAKIMMDSVSSGCGDLQNAARLGESSLWGEVATKDYQRYCKN